jgi:RNA polymerase sigma-70 factor (ECF subfamily)
MDTSALAPSDSATSTTPQTHGLAAARSSAEEASDGCLLDRCLAGDLQAVAALLERHRDPVFRACLALMGRREDAEDATQEAFVRAFRSLGRFRRGCAFRTWVIGIALNVCRSLLRRRKPCEELPEAPVAGADPERMLGQVATRAVLSSLPQETQQVLLLRCLEGCSYGEIAEALGCAESAVKDRVFRARRLFRQRYLKMMGEGTP